MSKTQVEQFLEDKNIPYERFVYSKDNINPETPIFKTLVLKGNKTGPTIAVVHYEERLDYKKMAAVSNNRKVGFPPIEYVLETTGYPHGANTPIGIQLNNPEYPIYFDENINNFSKIVVSAGELDKSVIISVKDLIALILPTIADLVVN